MKALTRMLQAGAFAGGVLAAVYYAGPALGSGPVTAIPVRAEPVPLTRADPAATRVGRLRFLGGLDLSSPDQRFGGISALLWEPACGRLLGVTDSGTWVVFALRESGDALTGVGEAWLAPILDTAGRAPRSKRDGDAESLARTPAGGVLVFFEGEHRAQRYGMLSACRLESLAQAAESTWVPTGAAGWPFNGGAEAAARRGDLVLAISEAAPGPGGGRAALLAAPGAPLSHSFAYAAPAGYEATALDALDPGGESGRMLVLHRRFTPLSGVSAILAEAEVGERPEGPVIPREIARLAPPYSVDNMEGLAVRAEGARRFIYMISDNNFNPLQRTLLLKFELLPAEATGPEAPHTKKGG